MGSRARWPVTILVLVAPLAACRPPASPGAQGTGHAPKAKPNTAHHGRSAKGNAAAVTARATAADLAAARELDQQGVRAFTEARYRQAFFFFEQAHRRGGPATELWNMARCQQKMDDVEGAVETLERYLEQPKLSAGEREEGRRELLELQRRPTRVTALSEPPGATVFLGERKNVLGKTPVSFDLPPGEHTVILEVPGQGARWEHVTARFGQPAVLDVDFR